MVLSGDFFQSIVKHTKIRGLIHLGTQYGVGAKKIHRQVELSRHISQGRDFSGRGSQNYHGRPMDVASQGLDSRFVDSIASGI